MDRCPNATREMPKYTQNHVYSTNGQQIEMFLSNAPPTRARRAHPFPLLRSHVCDPGQALSQAVGPVPSQLLFLTSVISYLQIRIHTIKHWTSTLGPHINAPLVCSDQSRLGLCIGNRLFRSIGASPEAAQ